MELLKAYYGREEWKLGLSSARGLSVLIAGMVLTGVAGLAVALWESGGGGGERRLDGLTAGLLFLDVLAAAAAAFGYILVSSRAPRPSQLHAHGLALLLMLASFTFYIGAQTFFVEERCSAWASVLAVQCLFFGAYKAVFFLLLRKRIRALGPAEPCCAWPQFWGLGLVASVVVTAASGFLSYAWAGSLALRDVGCEVFYDVVDADTPAVDRAVFLGSLAVSVLGIVGSFIAGSGMAYSALHLTRRAIVRLVERQVSPEELGRVELTLRRHLLGAFIGISSTQLALVGTLVGDLGLGDDESLFVAALATTVDLLGDVAGILLLSGIGGLLIREDPTAGDVSGHIRGLLHAAVLTARSEMAFEGRVDPGSKFCVVSFPGKYLADWQALTWACEQGDLSSACVFLPTADPQRRFGRHVEASEGCGLCWCHSLYGKEQPWGCMWFQAWKENVERAVQMELPLVVVFFPGQAGKGVVRWEDLGAADLWDGVGLGGSQKAEVAYLRMRGFQVVEEDLRALRRRVSHRSLALSAFVARVGSSVSAGVRSLSLAASSPSHAGRSPASIGAARSSSFASRASSQASAGDGS